MFGVKKLGGFFLGHDVDTEIMDLKLSFIILLTKPVRGSGRLKKIYCDNSGVGVATKH